MPSALADPPAAAPEQQAADAASAASAASEHNVAPAPPRSCAKCGAALADGQDWCLQCGSGAPESLSSATPSWRSAAIVLGALAVLIAGAASAAYAALKKSSSTPATVTTIAQASSAPAASTPAASTPAAAASTKTATSPSSTTAPALRKPAKIPITPSVTATPTTKAAIPTTPTTPTTTSTPTSTTGSETTDTSTSKSSGGAVGEAQPEALLLDTDAASTYNPYDYPAANFGDPSLAIDGDTSTAWTALVEPSVAPKMAEGIAIDLNTARRISAVELITETPGMTVQVYGSSAATLPSSITDPSWVALTPSFIERKRHVRINLGRASATIAAAAKRRYRFITLWISQAPAASIGTTEAPGHVSVNELELFPANGKS